MPIELTRATTAEAKWADSVVTQQRSYWQIAHEMMHDLRRQRFMRKKGSAPKPYQKFIGEGVKSPISYRFVQTIVGAIAKERPRFSRVPMNRDDSSAALRLQSSADPLLQSLEAVARKPLYWQFIDQLVGDGRGVMKVSRQPWSGFPIPNDGEPSAEYNRRVASFIMNSSSHPLRMRLVDPINFMVPPGEYEAPYVIETGARQTLALMDSLGLTYKNRKFEAIPGEQLPDTAGWNWRELPAGMPATVDMEEIWTPNVVFFRVGGNVFKAENDVGRLPYVWSFGEMSSNPDPSVEALSILYPYHGLEPWMNTILSVMAGWSIIGGVPTMYTTRKPVAGSPAGSDTVTVGELPLGKQVNLPPGGEIGFVNPPAVGRELIEFLKLLTDLMDRAGISPSASGIIGTRTPGTTYTTAIEAAMQKFAPLINNAQTALADVVKLCWQIIEQRGHGIWVTGIGLSERPLGLGRKPVRGRYLIDPKDIHGYYDLSATLKVSNLQDEISRGMHAAFMRAHNLWSRDRAMQYSGVDNPFEEYTQITRDKLEESPFVQNQILRAALESDPELAKRADSLEEQGVDIMALLTGQPNPNMEQISGAKADGSPTTTPGGVFGGAPQPRGRPAPSAGGRPSGSPRRPGGNRGGQGQGARFPK